MESYTPIWEIRHAIPMLMTVRDNEGMTMTDIVRVNRGGEQKKYAALKYLVDTGLLESRHDPDGEWNTNHLYLTAAGKKVIANVEEITKTMDESVSQAKDSQA